MFLSVSPARLPSKSLSKIGTSEGFGEIILCPKLFANTYPSPVEPVVGYDLPPVAITTISHSNFPFDVLTTNFFSFLTP